MSEPKRVPFTTTPSVPGGVPSVTGSFGVPILSTVVTNAASQRFGSDFLSVEEKCIGGSGVGSSNSRKNSDTVRLKLELFQTDSATYPEFNYAKLIHLEKKKLKKLKQKAPGTSDPFNENDEDVARIARELEKKYGSSYGSGRGRSKKDDQCDIGLGYDESDSFIDNTDAYDEVIPEEVETIEGGFYINCGALVFKKLHTESLTTKTDEIIKMPNRPKKRILSTSESSSSSDEESNRDDNAKNGNGVLPIAKDKSKGNGNGTSLSVEKRPKSPIPKKIQKDKPSGQPLSSSNSPKPSTDDVGSDSDKDRVRPKAVKTTTVKDMLKAKRDSFLKMQEGGEAKIHNGEIKGATSKSSNDDTSSNDSNDSTDVSDSNRDGSSEKKAKKPASTEDHTENLRTTDTKLPELESDLLNKIQKFKELVKSKNAIGKKFQFDEQLTEVFLKIDEELLCIEKNNRTMVFAHLEYQLSLPKYYFLRKAKQLTIKEENLKSYRALTKLRKAVAEALMTATINYEIEMKKYTELRNENLNAEHPPKMPKKKFPWNSNLRNLLYEVYQVRWTSYPVLGTRKETLVDFINLYLKNKVLQLWPNGWMRYEELQKEIEKRKTATKKAKEKLKTTVSCPISTKSSTTTATTTTIASTCQETIIVSLPVNSAYSKQYEDITVNSRSCANSDTDSVASSVASTGIKRKTTDTANKTKNKIQKLNGEQSASVGSFDLSKKQQMPSTIPPIVLDALTQSKRTDYSIQNIISSTSPPPSLSQTMSACSNQQQQLPPQKHSKANERPAHIIDLDNYTSTSDILQTSKQLLNAAAVAALTSSSLPLPSCSLMGNVKTDRNIIQPSSPVNTARRQESGSESDGVEIIGVFPAKPVPATIKSKTKKHTATQNNRVPGEFTAKLYSQSTGMGGRSPQATKIASTNNNNSKKSANMWDCNKYASDFGSGSKRAPIAEFDVKKVLKDLEDFQNLQQRPSSTSMSPQNASTKDPCQ